MSQVEPKRRAERLHKRYDWGDLCISFGAGFAACFLFFMYLLAR